MDVRHYYLRLREDRPLAPSGLRTPENGAKATGRRVWLHFLAWVLRVGWRCRWLWSRLPPKSRFFTRSSRYHHEPVAIVRWTLLWLAGLGLLLTLGALVGSQQGRGAASEPAFAHVAQPFQEIARTLTLPAVSVPLAFGLLILMSWSFRNGRLAWLVWRGGRIVVPDFHPGGKLTGSKPEELTALFRQRLAVLRLQSASPSPGAAPEGAFLDVLNSGGASSGNFLDTLLKLLRAAAPSHALEVQGLVRERKEVPRCGVAVQIVQESSQPSPMIEVWETTWDEAMRRAADEATAAILPRSRLCRGPWAAWRGYVMPPLS